MRGRPRPSAGREGKDSDSGVSLSFLYALAATIPSEWTTEDVVNHFIIPATKELECAYSVLPQVISTCAIGSASYFISHAWKSNFHSLISNLRLYFTSENKPSESTFVWLDIFAVNYHEDAERGPDLPQVVYLIYNCSKVLLHVDSDACCLSRIWCLTELYYSTLQAGSFKLHILINGSSYFNFYKAFHSLDVSKAVSTVEKHRNWLIEDLELHGTLQDVQRSIKQVILSSLRSTEDHMKRNPETYSDAMVKSATLAVFQNKASAAAYKLINVIKTRIEYRSLSEVLTDVYILEIGVSILTSLVQQKKLEEALALSSWFYLPQSLHPDCMDGSAIACESATPFGRLRHPHDYHIVRWMYPGFIVLVAEILIAADKLIEAKTMCVRLQEILSGSLQFVIPPPNPKQSVNTHPKKPLQRSTSLASCVQLVRTDANLNLPEYAKECDVFARVLYVLARIEKLAGCKTEADEYAYYACTCLRHFDKNVEALRMGSEKVWSSLEMYFAGGIGLLL